MTSKAFGLAQLGNAFNDGALGSRNKVINGAMVMAQRGETTEQNWLDKVAEIKARYPDTAE